MKEFIIKNQDQIFSTLKELCAIPSPSHFEHTRAEYCKNWLESIGAKDVYIDSALNVILPINCQNSNQITVFVAHTDTVFPDKEPLPYTDDGILIKSPGVSDDTASLAVLLYTAKYFIENNITTPNGIMFVYNSCEEGLGNLKGTKQLFSDYKDRIAQFVSFDSNLDTIADRCVGSIRYEVEVKTEGGHSFGAFGNKNAIAELAKIISQIYKIEVPKTNDSKTTYNVGTVEGGTSVNTIAQSAKMLCECRSDNRECLDIVNKEFAKIFESAKSDKVEIFIKQIGLRPCMCDVDINKINKLYDICSQIIYDTANIKTKRESSSTDCNIPLSLGVPAICIGVRTGGGIHTREEYLEKKSLPIGLEIAIKIATKLANEVV